MSAAALAIVGTGGFLTVIIVIAVIVLIYYRSTPEEGSKGNPFKNDDPEAKVIVVDEEELDVDRPCSGKKYIKRGACMRDGKVLDGTKELCGKGTEEWVLDPNDKDYQASVGDGACPSQFRECSVTCPKPCEGNTWKKGSCVRIDANGKKTVLDGTADRCGDGVLQQTLDQTAPDFKPAVGGGGCTFTKSGACNVKCPKPQPPQCSYPVFGWQDNDMGCVKSKTDHRKVACGETGVVQQYKASTLNTTKCAQLTQWVACKAKPCPVDCEGTWGKGWSACKGACDTQPERVRTYTITKKARHGGKACPYADGEKEYKNCGKITQCCKITGNWELDRCKPNGKGKYTKDHTGACDSKLVKKEDTCCYQGYDWKDSGKCSSKGKQLQVQTTKNCPKGTEKRTIDCSINCEGEWVEKSEEASRCAERRCGRGGGVKKFKQHFTRYYDEYKITQPAVGQGSQCPYKDGSKRNIKEKGFSPQTAVACFYGKPC
jgi:hypothetical protein